MSIQSFHQAKLAMPLAERVTDFWCVTAEIEHILNVCRQTGDNANIYLNMMLSNGVTEKMIAQSVRLINRRVFFVQEMNQFAEERQFRREARKLASTPEGRAKVQMLTFLTETIKETGLAYQAMKSSFISEVTLCVDDDKDDQDVK